MNRLNWFKIYFSSKVSIKKRINLILYDSAFLFPQNDLHSRAKFFESKLY